MHNNTSPAKYISLKNNNNNNYGNFYEVVFAHRLSEQITWRYKYTDIFEF